VTDIAKAGTLININEGAYSSNATIGVFVVLQDFDPMQRVMDFWNSIAPENDWKHFDSDKFVGALIKNGLLLEVNVANLYLGGYGDPTGHDGAYFSPADRIVS
jgi:hypothetical protein